MPKFAHAFEGSDAEALQEHLARFGMLVTARPLPGMRSLATHGSIAADTELRVWDGGHGHGLRMTSDRRPDAMLVYVPLAGQMQVEVGRAPSTAAVGDVLVGSALEFEAIEFAAGTRTQGLSIDHAALNERLARLIDRAPTRPLRFDDPVALNKATTAFVSVLAGVVAASLHGGLQLDSPALAGLTRALPDLLLECLPNTYSEAIRRRPPAIAPRQVRRAMAYIRDQPMPVLTTDELADICGVSVRSLQYTFREFVGVAPAEYWRKVRLELALEQLKRNPPESVSRIAAEWGFTNVTRFRALAGLA